jgi:hypothetical protein
LNTKNNRLETIICEKSAIATKKFGTLFDLMHYLGSTETEKSGALREKQQT